MYISILDVQLRMFLTVGDDLALGQGFLLKLSPSPVGQRYREIRTYGDGELKTQRPPRPHQTSAKNRLPGIDAHTHSNKCGSLEIRSVLLCMPSVILSWDYWVHDVYALCKETGGPVSFMEVQGGIWYVTYMYASGSPRGAFVEVPCRAFTSSVRWHAPREWRDQHFSSDVQSSLSAQSKVPTLSTVVRLQYDSTAPRSADDQGPRMQLHLEDVALFRDCVPRCPLTSSTVLRSGSDEGPHPRCSRFALHCFPPQAIRKFVTSQRGSEPKLKVTSRLHNSLASVPSVSLVFSFSSSTSISGFAYRTATL